MAKPYPSDIQKAYCPIVKPIELIGDTWILLILKCLYSDKRRYNQIKMEIPHINNRTLSHRLKKLQELNLITRTVDDSSTPPLVHYQLTELGCGVKPIIDEIEKFGNLYLC